MAVKPDYAALLAAYAAETDPVLKEQLKQQAYSFPVLLTEEEKQLFSYCADGYIENNPGMIDGIYSSYVGKYFSPDGVLSQ